MQAIKISANETDRSVHKVQGRKWKVKGARRKKGRGGGGNRIVLQSQFRRWNSWVDKCLKKVSPYRTDHSKLRTEDTSSKEEEEEEVSLENTHLYSGKLLIRWIDKENWILSAYSDKIVNEAGSKPWSTIEAQRGGSSTQKQGLLYRLSSKERIKS